MAFYGHFIAFYGLLWQNIDLIGLLSSFLAVIDPNSFGLVYSILRGIEIPFLRAINEFFKE